MTEELGHDWIEAEPILSTLILPPSPTLAFLEVMAHRHIPRWLQNHLPLVWQQAARGHFFPKA